MKFVFVIMSLLKHNKRGVKMAAIEKICEYSEDGYSVNMRKYAKNRIQILPECRKFFKNQKAVLYIKKTPSIINDQFFGKLEGEDLRIFQQRRRQGVSLSKVNSDHYFHYREMVFSSEHEYYLNVPTRQGKVEGKYYHYTTDRGAMRRKLQRLVGGKRFLKIRKID